jgi:hypothetical protein
VYPEWKICIKAATMNMQRNACFEEEKSLAGKAVHVGSTIADADFQDSSLHGCNTSTTKPELIFLSLLSATIDIYSKNYINFRFQSRVTNIQFYSRTFRFGAFQQTQNTAVFLATTQNVVCSKVKEYVELNTKTFEELQHSIVQILTGTTLCTFLVLFPPSPKEYQLSFKQNV